MKKKAGLLLLGAAILFAGTDNTSYASEKPELAQAIDEVIGTPYKWGGTTTSGFEAYYAKRYVTVRRITTEKFL